MTRPNGLRSQIAKRLESIKQNDPPSGEALMRVKAERFKTARASSKGPFSVVKDVMDQYVEMAAGKYNEEGMSR